MVRVFYLRPSRRVSKAIHYFFCFFFLHNLFLHFLYRRLFILLIYLLHRLLYLLNQFRLFVILLFLFQLSGFRLGKHTNRLCPGGESGGGVDVSDLGDQRDNRARCDDLGIIHLEFSINYFQSRPVLCHFESFIRSFPNPDPLLQPFVALGLFGDLLLESFFKAESRELRERRDRRRHSLNKSRLKLNTSEGDGKPVVSKGNVGDRVEQRRKNTQNGKLVYIGVSVRSFFFL